ncbi:hypothetical protein DY000_02056192 [Brassica cretica]|uniref:Uncharacterized protein n=1 Tax=Brassica cretica TaxID=69181 RepID=A0ABQ7AJ70_BRACR|nr:hypothetical protein DY000_02056192 [Brassica cretica]
MGDGSLLLDVYLSQQEQWMEVDVYHSQGKSMDGMEKKNRHKLGGLKLDKTRLLSLVSHRKKT